MVNAFINAAAPQSAPSYKVQPAKIRGWSWRRRKAWYARTAPALLRSGNPLSTLATEEVPIRFCGWSLSKDALGRVAATPDIVSFIVDQPSMFKNRARSFKA